MTPRIVLLAIAGVIVGLACGSVLLLALDIRSHAAWAIALIAFMPLGMIIGVAFDAVLKEQR